MQRLFAKNLYIGDLKLISENITESVVVYKKEDRYYDMKYVFSKVDFNDSNVVFYKEKPTFNCWYGLAVNIEKDSLKNFYGDGREIFDIYELHNEIDKPKKKVKK